MSSKMIVSVKKRKIGTYPFDSFDGLPTITFKARQETSERLWLRAIPMFMCVILTFIFTSFYVTG